MEKGDGEIGRGTQDQLFLIKSFFEYWAQAYNGSIEEQADTNRLTHGRKEN